MEGASQWLLKYLLTTFKIQRTRSETSACETSSNGRSMTATAMLNPQPESENSLMPPDIQVGV